MNSLWKRSWKENTGTERQKRQMDGLSGGASLVDGAEAVHPSADVCLQPPTAQDRHSTLKRTNSCSGDVEPISKRSKAEDQLSNGGASSSSQVDQTAASVPDLPHSEHVMIYKKEQTIPEKTLLHKCWRITPVDSFWPCTESARDALVELGRCASDLIWRRALEEAHNKELQTALQGDENLTRNTVRDWTFALPNLDPGSRGYNVSHKFLVLVDTLRCFASCGAPYQGVVLVRKRSIAVTLVDLFFMLRPHLEFLRPVAILNKITSNDVFKQGLYNLAILTSVENILELKDPSCIILFDEVEGAALRTLRSHHLKHKFHLIHLVREGNEAHRDQISQRDVPDKAPVSPDSLEFLEDPTTRKRITPSNAPSIISAILRLRYPNDEQDTLAITETNSGNTGSQYTCTVELAGLPSVVGTSGSSPKSAEESACFKACELLGNLGILDYRLFPTPSPPDNLGDIFLEYRHRGTKVYARKSPVFWEGALDPTTVPRLYPLVLAASGTEEDFSPMVLLTTRPTPDLADIRLYRYLKPFTVTTSRVAPLEVNTITLNKIYRYTLRIIRAITNKPLECPLEKMTWFILPLTRAWAKAPRDPDQNSPFSLPSIDKYIPWNAITLGGDNFISPIKVASCEEVEEDIENAVIQDRWVEFTKRYVAIRVRPDLTPLSAPVDGTRESGHASYLEYCQSRIKDFQGLKDDGQPLVEVGMLHSASNHLRASTPSSYTPPASSQTRFLIPELCAKCTLPASVMISAALIPSITRRIDDSLIVKELNAKLFECSISEELLHQALSTPSANLEYNYERLELLGDSYLKYLTSVYVYAMNPTFSEGALHGARQPLISNKSLFQHAWEAKLPLYIQSVPFTFRNWLPLNFTFSDGTVPNPRERELVEVEIPPVTQVNDAEEEEEEASQVPQHTAGSSKRKKKKNRGNKSDKSHELGDKSLADVIEAIIGAAYLSGGDGAGLKATKALGIQLEGVEQWSDFVPHNISYRYEVKSSVPLEALQAIERAIAHPVDHFLLSEALNPRSKSFERLEFLGDAIIDFSAIRYMYDEEPSMTPGGLTLLKGAMVSNAALAAACVWSGLHKHLIHDPQVVRTTIRDYLLKLDVAREKAYTIASSEGRQPGQYWANLECPKILSDALEAVVGAVFVSDRFSLVGVEHLFENALKPFFRMHISFKTLTHHPTKNLFELLQAKGCHRFRTSKVRVRGITKCSFFLHDHLLATGEDRVGSVAAKRASLAAFNALEEDPTLLPSQCDCRVMAPPTKKEQEEAREILALEEEKDSDGSDSENRVTKNLEDSTAVG